jgi:hypothetical protein
MIDKKKLARLQMLAATQGQSTQGMGAQGIPGQDAANVQAAAPQESAMAPAKKNRASRYK